MHLLQVAPQHGQQENINGAVWYVMIACDLSNQSTSQEIQVAFAWIRIKSHARSSPSKKARLRQGPGGDPDTRNNQFNNERTR
jgi:hypothetical protein